MHFEEARQQHAGGVGQVRSRATFDLREIGLAQAAAHFFLKRDGQLLLRHFAVQSAQGGLHQTQVPKFLPEFHITISNYNIAICNVKKWIWFIINRLRRLAWGSLHFFAANLDQTFLKKTRLHTSDRTSLTSP